MTSRWFPFRFQSSQQLPGVYLTPDSSTPRSLLVIPEFDFPLPPLPLHAESPCPTPNDHIDHNPPLPSSTPTHDPTHPADMSPRRPNKLRKPPPSRLRAGSVTPMLPALLHVLSIPLAGGGVGEADAVMQQTHVRPDGNVTIHDGLPPSPTPSNATVSAGSHAPLMAASRMSSSLPSAPRPMSTPARKLTKRRQQSSTSYFKLTDDNSNIGASRSALQSTHLPTGLSHPTTSNGTDARPGASPIFQNLPPSPISDDDRPSDSWLGSGRPRRQRGDSVPDLIVHPPTRNESLCGRSHSEIRYREAEKEFLPPVRPTSPFCVNIVGGHAVSILT
jgi:hypothetical protein